MEVSLWKFVIFFAGFVTFCHGKEVLVQSLDGQWVARETNYWYEFPATVPGGTYTDLMNVKILDDVFYGYNDNSSRWVGQIDWTYSRNFTVEANVLKYNQVNLVLEGVDTFATIVVNNITVGETQNMFVRYVFDVKSALKVGNNNITVQFKSPIQVGLELNNKQLSKYRIPWECPPDAYRGECHINMIRKMQASFSWDWGPAFPSMGLWKPVYLEAFDESVIRYVVPHLEESSVNWRLSVDTYFSDNQKNAVNGTLRISAALDLVEISRNEDVNEKINSDGEIVKTVILVIPKNQVKLWWPNGYGSQPLYELKVEFKSGDAISSKTVNVGFRSVELVQDSLGANGATFYFKINGQPIFAKGSNEIPISVLPEQGQDEKTIRYLLQSAKDVNMNMLRVWGGGVYESDYFYELADQMGIMIWQDFMFACSLYPADQNFTENVLAEVNHNIKRMYHHPSIVVYSGNNENEGVLVDNWYSTQDNFEQYKKDYVKLYITTIRTEFERITKGKGLYISSSPSNGKKTESEGWIGESPSNQDWGDVHFYNYVVDPWESTTYPVPRVCSEYGYQSIPFEDSWSTATAILFHFYNYVVDPWESTTYPVPRFCSEYGYQSIPFEDSWSTATNNSADLEIDGHFMDTRQHHPLGNGELVMLIANNLKLPEKGSENYSSAVIYMSQVYAAQSIKVETEHYRRYRSYLDDAGRGYTMGALYWQLNDVWVAPTWSSIDFTGRWKMLHYFARDMFANVIVTGHINEARELQLYTVNDQLSPVEDVSVVIRVFEYNSPDFKPLYEKRTAENLNASASQLIQTIQTDRFLKEQNCDKLTCFFHFVIQKNSSLTNTVAISPENYVFPGKLYKSSLASPYVHIFSVKKSSSKTYEITVQSDNIALFVWLDSHSVRGQFSENGFLQVEQNRTVWFNSEQDVTADGLRKVLTVTHLTDPRWTGKK